MTDMTRRRVLALTCATLASAQWPRAAAATPYNDAEAADTWMTQWNQQARAVKGLLTLARFADPMYVLTNEIEWSPNEDRKKDFPVVKVPVGFVTDFASIPRAFWSSLRPDGLYGYAAIVHDWLYWEQSLPRDHADEVFKLAMEDFEVGTGTVQTIYRAVRAGGSFAWKGNAKLKKKGEKRLLKKLPTDPTTRWDDWKQRPDVF